MSMHKTDKNRDIPATNENLTEVKINIPNNEQLFDRIVSILEQARNNVVKVVNSNMIIAYWLIGREIVQEIQKGKDRAEYGQEVIKKLSEKLTTIYGRGFSITNLRYFRNFYSVYSKRTSTIRHIGCGESITDNKNNVQSAVLDDMSFAIESQLDG